MLLLCVNMFIQTLELGNCWTKWLI